MVGGVARFGDVMIVAILSRSPGVPSCQIWAKQADLRIARALYFCRESPVAPARLVFFRAQGIAKRAGTHAIIVVPTVTVYEGLANVRYIPGLPN